MITEVVASAFFKSKIIPECAFGEGGRQQQALSWGWGCRGHCGVNVHVLALNSCCIHHHKDKWAESAL